MVIAGNVTLASGSVFTANMGFELDSDWTNNGGTFNAGGDTIILGGASNIIGGTSSTSFPTLQIGKSTGSSAASYSMNNNNTCDYIVFDASAGNRTLTLGSGVILTVINDITINQPSSTNTTNSLFINSAACNINENLNFSGGNNNATKVCQVVVT